MDPQEGFSKDAVDNLEDEAYTVITAAADTTSNAMTTMTRCVVESPTIYRRLHAGLCEAFPDPNTELTYAALEKLPYLVRPPPPLSPLQLTVPRPWSSKKASASPASSPPVAPPSTATASPPPNTVVSMSSWILHQDEHYFPRPTAFDPERWADPREAQRLERAFVPFGKGSRARVGMNLGLLRTVRGDRDAVPAVREPEGEPFDGRGLGV